MYGYNFCKASIMAVMLITSNVLQVAAVNAINRYVMLLGKLVVVVSCVIAGYMWITYSPDFQGEKFVFLQGVKCEVVCCDSNTCLK